MSRTISTSFITNRLRFSASLFDGPFAKELGDIEVHEIGVVKNDRFDRALHLVALVTVRGDNVQDFAGNAVLVRERDAAEWMTHLLSEFSLDHFARSVFVVLERFAHVSQQRTGDEVVTLNGNVAAKRFLQHIRNGDALPRTGIEMLDKGHVYVAREQCELHCTQLIESPPLPPATGGNRFTPHSCHLFAERLVLDPLQAGKKSRDLRDAIVGSFARFHGNYIGCSRYFCGFEDVRSIIFLASKSSLTVSPYQLMFPENLLFNLLFS